MGLQQVLWMLVLTFSTCWKVQVKPARVSDTNLSYNHNASYFFRTTADTPHHSLLLMIHNKEQRTPLTSAGEYDKNICALENELTGTAAAMNSAVNTTKGERGRQKQILKILRLQKTREVSMLTTDEASSLGQMLVTVVKAELTDCALVVAYDTGYSEHAVLQHLLLLHNPRQMVKINTTEDLTRIIWTSSKCRGYFFLLDDPEPMLTFARTYQDTWDYSGRYVLALPSLRNLEEFLDTQIGKNTEHILGVVKSGTEGEWVLYMNQLYWGPGVRRINTWYRHRFTRQLDLFPDKLSDLQGAVLKVSAFHFEPCNFLHRAENGTVVLFYGTDVETVKAVAHALNITLEFVETPNGETWGEMFENGSWYGLMGQLQRHEVDIGLANLFVSKHWLQVIELTAPYRTEVTGFMIRVEPPLPQWQALSFPFNKWTWLGVLVGVIVSGPLLFLLARGSGRCGGEIKNLQVLSFAWYYAFGLHFCEAHKSLPRNPCTQIFVQFLWLYTLVLTTSYTASLKAFLLLKKKPYMIQTIQELYESGLEVGAPTDLYVNEFAASTNPYLQGLTRAFKYYDALEDIYIPVLQGSAVYLGNGISIEYQMNRFSRFGASLFRIMKESYRSYSVSLGLQRHSPLKRKFDVVVGWIQQSGLYAKFTYESVRLHNSLQKDDGGVDDIEIRTDGVVALNIDNMQGVFIITAFGWLCSGLCFMLEKTIFSR